MGSILARDLETCDFWWLLFLPGRPFWHWIFNVFLTSISEVVWSTLALQNLQKSTPNPLEIRFFHYLFFERVLHSILVRFLVAPNLKNIDFTKEKQGFSRNLLLQTKVPKAWISGWFCKLKSMKKHRNIVRANDIAIFFQFSWNFTNFRSILGSKIHPQTI